MAARPPKRRAGVIPSRLCSGVTSALARVETSYQLAILPASRLNPQALLTHPIITGASRSRYG